MIFWVSEIINDIFSNTFPTYTDFYFVIFILC